MTVRAFILFSLFGWIVYSQTEAQNLFVTKPERARFVTEKVRFIDSVFSQIPNIKNEKNYQSAFWASELMLLKSSIGKEKLKYALSNFTFFSDSFKRSVLQNIFTLYPSEFVTYIDSLVDLEYNEKLFAMMANYLIRQKPDSEQKYFEKLKKHFPDWKGNAILNGFAIEHSVQPTLTDNQLNDLIAFRKEKRAATIFVFVQKNRDIPGFAMILDSNGCFLKDKNDTLKIRLLARSITNLSGYLTNGNTPQGVFSVQGFGLSDNVFIGTSLTINTVLPWEVSLKEFTFGKIDNSEWTLDVYNEFFPESWKMYLPKNMAYYAGKAGRSEIVIHGTTIDTNFYINQTYYPFTPSLGCLCALEYWNETDGSLLESEQMKLVKALKNNKINKALMYVIER
ncbi:MAG: hypothetical protein ACOYMD_02670 [Paludibacter sp.]